MRHGCRDFEGTPITRSRTKRILRRIAPIGTSGAPQSGPGRRALTTSGMSLGQSVCLLGVDEVVTVLPAQVDAVEAFEIIDH